MKFNNFESRNLISCTIIAKGQINLIVMRIHDYISYIFEYHVRCKDVWKKLSKFPRISSYCSYFPVLLVGLCHIIFRFERHCSL